MAIIQIAYRTDWRVHLAWKPAATYQQYGREIVEKQVWQRTSDMASSWERKEKEWKWKENAHVCIDYYAHKANATQCQ